jgi:small conductance mechanosensitive channel
MRSFLQQCLKRTRVLWHAAVVASLAAAPGGAQEPSLAPVSPQPAEDRPATVPVTPTATDARIATRIETILAATGWYEASGVLVREGIVFLDGVAGTQEQRRWAGTLAQSIEGVVAVVNRIEVTGDVTATFERAGDEVAEFGRRTLAAVPLLVLAITILAAAWAASWIVNVVARGLLRDRIGSPLLLGVVARAISIPVLLLGIYFVLRLAGLTQLALTVLGGTGVAGIIIGFAFRDIAENFLASLLLSMRNPFRSGDLIEVAGHTGVVENLNTRSTVLQTLDGNQVQIPNAMVFKSTIKNYSSIANRRAEFFVGIGYESSIATAQRLIADVLHAHPAVLEAPEPLVLVDELGAATVNLRVFYWFNSTTYSPARINSALLRQTKNVLLEAGIELPDPAREVVFPKGVPIIEASAGQEVSRPQTRHAPSAAEDASAAVAAEGDLSSETTEIRQRPGATVPEASVNLLKDED